jgi:hypothetical protein
MPKQYGPIQITGTIDNVCFYKMDGVYYARMKSSLTRKRVLKSAAFRRTREHAATLGEASTIASRIYRLIPKARRKHILYREMTGKAIYLLREGKDKEVVFQSLSALYLKQDKLPEPAVSCVKKEAQDDRGYSGKQQPPVPRLQKTCPGSLAGTPTRAGNIVVKNNKLKGVSRAGFPVRELKKGYRDADSLLPAARRGRKRIRSHGLDKRDKAMGP